MEIKGLDYNTQREKLVMPEYGREIQKMVAHAMTLPSKEERTRCARTIVRMMETKVPQLRDNKNYEQTLWDHLFIIGQGNLDIDWPYDVSAAESIHAKPAPMKKPQKPIRLRHYGHLVEQTLERIKQMPAGKERDELVRQTANQMKRDLATWGHGSMDDAKVADDLARYTDGLIQLNLQDFTFEKVTPITQPTEGRKKKKR
jgi:hypothetical protein